MERKKLFFKKMKKLFIFPLLVFVSLFLFSAYLYVNADEFVNQDAPFIIQGTATNNNTTIDPVGDHAYLVEKRGYSEVINGQIVDANGNDLVCVGRNVWNEQWELGSINLSTGVNDTSDEHIRSVDYIPIVPNRDYYFLGNIVRFAFYDINYDFIDSLIVNVVNAKFTTPNNAYYMRFYVNGTSYNYDVCLSLWYDDEAGYDEYYPYQSLTQVNTGTEVLRSAGNAYDVKTSNGVIVRNVAFVDLGDLDWDYDIYGRFIAVIDGMVSFEYNENLLSDKFVVNDSPIGSGSVDNSIIGWTGSSIYIQCSSYSDVSSFVNYVDGSILYYEVATPSQEQGSTFNQVLSVDDFGSMYWLDVNGDLINIPQGNRITYVYNFVYAWYEPILRAITGSFKELGGSIIDWIKNGFVQLFTYVEVVEGVNVYHPSEVVYFTFILMGIALACGLTYFIVRLLRRSR